MTPIRYLSLPALKERLDQEFEGAGPSIATLKRWASSGVLNAARQSSTGNDGRERRVKFDLVIAKRIILARWEPRTDSKAIAHSERLSAPNSPTLFSGPTIAASTLEAACPIHSHQDILTVPKAEFEALHSRIQQQGEQLEAMIGILREVQRDAAEMRSARTALMRKYDESNSMQLQLIAELKGGRGGDGKAGDSILELSRIAAGISRLSDRMANLESGLEELGRLSHRR